MLGVTLVCVTTVILLLGAHGPRGDADTLRPPAEATTAETDDTPLPGLDGSAALRASRPLASDMYQWPRVSSRDVTPFQRRLLFGGYVRALRKDIRSGRLTRAEAYKRYRAQPQILHPAGQFKPLQLDGPLQFHDTRGVPRKTPEEGASFPMWLSQVAAAGLDRESLFLSGATVSKEPLGTDLMVRVWRKGKPYEHRDWIASGTHLMERLDRLCKTRSRLGFDVFAAPDLGAATFPAARLPAWAGGVYLRADEFIIVRTGYRHPFGRRLLRHELAHAWIRQHQPPLKLRFMGEGFAEYLSHLRPSDRSLRMPMSRFRHRFARLLQLIEKVEARTGRRLRLDIGLLVNATPAAFYAYAPLSYLIAEAAMVYVGSAHITHALVHKDPTDLANRLRSIGWPELLAFIRLHAEGGDPERAMVFVDRISDVGGSWRHVLTDPLRSSAHKLGFGLHPLWLDAIEDPPPTLEELRDPGALEGAVFRIKQALERDAAAFVSDATPAMRATIDVRGQLKGLFSPGAATTADPETRLDYVTRWWTALASRAPKQGVRPFAASQVVTQWKAPFTPALTALSSDGLMRWISGARHGVEAAIVCVASSDEKWRSRMRTWLINGGVIPAGSREEDFEDGLALAAKILQTRKNLRPHTVLVVDLDAGTSDAVWLARTWARAFAGRAQVVYWDPQATAPGDK